MNRHKPLIRMTETERRDAFDEIGYAANRRMLDAARHQGKDSRLAAVFLIRADHTDALVSYQAEYGDGEGTRCERAFIDEIDRQKLLLPGESLELRIL